MSLFTKHRPASLEDMVGNKHVTSAVSALLDKKDKKEVPHSWLFTGMTGSGKTTIARIIAKQLGATASGIFEINSSDLTGVDSVRDIAQKCRYRMPGSKTSVYIFDECFHRDTQVEIINGTKSICDVVVGDKVVSLSGCNEVEKVFENKVELSRVVMVVTEDTAIVCSSSHKFFTSKGWIEAQYLKDELVLSSEYSAMSLLHGKGFDTNVMQKKAKGNPDEFDRVLVEELVGASDKIFKKVLRVDKYSMTNNENFWSSFISRLEIRQGFVTFYDLQIKNHPSYNANGLMVHNCHMWSASAQNAILKVLEDSPKHSYFILATTDPTKLIQTIRTRCEEFAFGPVETETIAELVANTADKEGIKVSDDVIFEIAANAAGSPRLALNMLERCLVVGDDLAAAKKLVSGLGLAFQVEGEFNISGDIFSALTDNRNRRAAWQRISQILEVDVLKPKLNVNSVKQGLTSRMGRFLLKSPHSGVADAVLILESINNMYSSASFVAVMFKVTEAYYKGGVLNVQPS